MDIFDRIWDIEYKVRKLREDRVEAYNQAMPSAVAYKPDKVQTSVQGYRIEDAVIKCTEIDERIDRLEEERLHWQKILAVEIRKLPQKEKLVLSLRFISMERWKQICCIMGVSKQRVHKLCKQGKTKVEENNVSLENVDLMD